jgi:phage tail sheath protein FI
MPTYLSPGVYLEEVESGSRPIQGVGTAVAAFIGFTNNGPCATCGHSEWHHQPTTEADQKTVDPKRAALIKSHSENCTFACPKFVWAGRPYLVSNWSQYTAMFRIPGDTAPLAQSVYAYFQNGGGNCFIVRIGQGITVKGIATPLGIEAKRTEDTSTTLQIVARDPNATPGSIRVEVVEEKQDGADTPPVLRLVVQSGDAREQYDVVTARGNKNTVSVVNSDSRLISIASAPTGALEALQAGMQLPLSAAPNLPARPMTKEDFVGEVAERTGLAGLEAIDEVTMVCMPDLVMRREGIDINEDTILAVQKEMLAHCENMGDRMAILDTQHGTTVQEAQDWIDRASYGSAFGALYWPWINVGNNTFLPPSGFVAGIWGRNDDTRGVHKAPANEIVRGAIGLETQITRDEHDLLNPKGVNCLRVFPGRGIRVWGARTLEVDDQSWRYVNIRRYMNYLEESILEGTDWVVFEPNDPALWARIRRTISAFLVNEWRKGALFGVTPDEAFFVKCDDETNPSEAIDAGEVNCQIGVAPIKPAEFVIFHVSQYSGGTSLVAE